MYRENHKDLTDLRLSPESARQVYARPALRVFGQVGALTQSGTMNGTEMVMMNGECSLGQMNMC